MKKKIKKIIVAIATILLMSLAMATGAVIQELYDRDLVGANLAELKTAGFEEAKTRLSVKPHETTYMRFSTLSQLVGSDWLVVNQFDGEFAYRLDKNILYLSIGKEMQDCKIHNVQSAEIVNSEELTRVDGFEAIETSSAIEKKFLTFVVENKRYLITKDLQLYRFS